MLHSSELYYCIRICIAIRGETLRAFLRYASTAGFALRHLNLLPTTDNQTRFQTWPSSKSIHISRSGIRISYSNSTQPCVWNVLHEGACDRSKEFKRRRLCERSFFITENYKIAHGLPRGMYLLFGLFRDQSATAFSKPARALRVERYIKFLRIKRRNDLEQVQEDPWSIIKSINNKVKEHLCKPLLLHSVEKVTNESNC